MPHARENKRQVSKDGQRAHSAPYVSTVTLTSHDASTTHYISADEVEPLSRPAKTVFLGIGWMCFSLGHLVSSIPKLRATLFVIAAHWCFLQSSPRWQGWLYRHPKHGFVLQDWHHHQRVPKSIKASATITLVVGATLIGISFGRLPLVAFGLFVCLPIACFLWTRPVTPE